MKPPVPRCRRTCSGLRHAGSGPLRRPGISAARRCLPGCRRPLLHQVGPFGRATPQCAIAGIGSKRLGELARPERQRPWQIDRAGVGAPDQGVLPCRWRPPMRIFIGGSANNESPFLLAPSWLRASSVTCTSASTSRTSSAGPPGRSAAAAASIRPTDGRHDRRRMLLPEVGLDIGGERSQFLRVMARQGCQISLPRQKPVARTFSPAWRDRS